MAVRFLTDLDLAEAVETALEQAKLSGEFDGPAGPQGEKGEQGIQGEQGQPGATPVKGVDYFTEEDIQLLVGDVLAALPTWEGGAY